MTATRTELNHGDVNRLTAKLNDATLEERFLGNRHEIDMRRIRMAAAIAVPVSLIFAVLDWWVITENVNMALAVRAWMGIIGPGMMYAMTYVGFFRSRLKLSAWIIVVSTTLSYAVLNGVSDSPDEYLSGYIIILMFLYFLLPVGYLTSVTIGVACTIAFAASLSLMRSIDTGVLLTIYSQYAVTLLAGSFAVYQVNILRRYEFLNELKIDEQKQQYFELLTRILPETIVERIEKGEKQIADNVPNAVVLFADVVGFTEMAAEYRPEEVVAVLDGLFEKFDQRVAAHRLEKIKTIGDAYMVAGNVPEPRSGYAAAAAELALDMLEVAADNAGPDGEPIHIRLGIHIGPVLAGVIGKTRFGYDLWGDTVNLASRLQGGAAPGEIHVSQAVQEELATKYIFRPLGAVALKGIGEVPTWILLGRNNETSRKVPKPYTHKR